MIRIEFTSEEIDALESQRYHHPDAKVMRKMEALYLKSQGLAHHDICRIVRISETTLTTGDTTIRLGARVYPESWGVV